MGRRVLSPIILDQWTRYIPYVGKVGYRKVRQTPELHIAEVGKGGS